MSEVVCVGIAALDRVFQVETHAGSPGKYRARQRRTVGGGVAANAAVTVARLGGRARFLGVIGDDATGHLIREGLDAEGVDTAGLQTIAGAQSPESVVQIDRHGERLIINHASEGLFATPAAFPDRIVERADAVLVDMRWRNGAVAALQAAADAGIPAIVDCDHDPVDSPGIIEEASHIVFSLPTLLTYTGLEAVPSALREARTRTGAWVAATAGADGSYWLADSGELSHQPAFPVTAVDTLGAGDVFHGAFALSLGSGMDVAEAMRFGAAAAALKCTRFGGRSGIPRRAELDAFMEDE